MALWDVYAYKLMRRLVHRMNGKSNSNMHTNGELRLLRNLMTGMPKDAHIVDIGCHRAEWLKVALAAPVVVDGDGRFVGVEASSEFFNHLKSEIGSDSKVKLLHCAISDKSGEQTFYVQTPGTLKDGSNSLYSHYYLSRPGSSSYKVQTTTVDQLINDLKISKIHICKMDIEGSEIPALKGATNALRNKMINFIQVEYTQNWLRAGTSLSDLYEICNQTGYSLYRIQRKALIRFPERYEYPLDDFVLANLLLVSPDAQFDYPVLGSNRI